ncbi:MAG: NAD(P)-dependent oxidoreductase [Hyphomicrobiales bacterium]|nr:MAG: NAD(P)-dependent oxidoreductase [Hyphomicrobiales bacterium]
MNVGYVGLGNMGGALASRLAPQGNLAVYDLDPKATQRLVELGATAAASPADLAKNCDTIVLCLPTSAHVHDVIFRAGGMASELRPGTVIIDQTSGDPRETRAIADDLAQLQVDLVDAPVSGGPFRAADGTIAIMVGATGEQYDAVLPLLRVISPNVFRAGELGSGHLIKLVNNMVSGVIRWITMEGVALAAKYGVAPENAVEIMSAGGARNDWMVAVMGPQVIRGDLSNGFSVGLAHKDLKLACELGNDASVPLLVGNLTREIYQMCINEMGFDTKVDSTALMMDRMAGTHVVPANYQFA